LWTWCLEQHRDALLDLMAFCAARTINAVQSKGDGPDCERLLHADRLADAVKLDMTQWFTPTAGNYFGRITKTGILAALAEVKGFDRPGWGEGEEIGPCGDCGARDCRERMAAGGAARGLKIAARAKFPMVQFYRALRVHYG
jgi:hypothetical protein